MSIKETSPAFEVPDNREVSGGYELTVAEQHKPGIAILTMDESWVKIHRKILEHWIYSRPDYVSIWLYLIARANWKPSKVLLNGSLVRIERGEVLTSIGSLAEKTHTSRQTVRTFLRLAEVDGMITVKSNTAATRVKLLNYEKLQQGENHDQHTPNTRLTNGQPTPNHIIRSKEVKKERKKELKEEKEGRAKARPHALSDVIEYMATIGLPEAEARKFMDYYDSNGWKVGKSPMKDWKAACRNWKLRYNEHKAPVNALQARTKPQGIPKAVSELYARPSVPTEVITEYLDKIKNK